MMNGKCIVEDGKLKFAIKKISERSSSAGRSIQRHQSGERKTKPSQVRKPSVPSRNFILRGPSSLV
jgi:hypothetical protein